MYVIRLFLFVILTCLSTHAGAQTVHFVGIQVNVVDGQLAPFNNIRPGDTLIIEKGIRPFLIFKNINGVDSLPVIIINGQGVVEINSDHYFGISIRMCKHIRLTGTGYQNEKYGIKIFNRKGSGLSIGDFSSFFETDHIEIGHSEFSGIVAKTEPYCGFDRNMFLQERTIIHDCYIHHSGTEGMYIGSTFYNGQTINCNGASSTVYPPLLRDVFVYNNLVEFSGWDGIQVSSAINANIFNNTVRYDSQKLEYYQMTGIALGGGSTGMIYNNRISDGEGIGIFTNGLGEIYIYNNEILRPGKSRLPASQRYGMFIDDKNSISGMNFFIYNNLILHPPTTGIYFNCTDYHKNEIFNNVIFINPEYGNVPEYIRCNGKEALISHNFLSNHPENGKFQNYHQDNFLPEEGSLLIDAGKEIPAPSIKTDINGYQRQQGNRVDLGPNESSHSSNINVTTETQSDWVYPNPGRKNEKTTIVFNNPQDGWITFRLLDFTGKVIRKISEEYYSKGLQYKIIDNQILDGGINYIQIIKRRQVSLVRISIEHD